MKTKTLTFMALAILALALPTATHAAPARYQVIPLGSIGGTNYYETFSGLTGRLMNNSGTVVAGMDTSVPDPFCYNASCLTSHAFEWTNGLIADLGTLEFNEQGNFSQSFEINNQGRSVGVSTYNATGQSGEPLLKAVTWKDRQITDLGTLGGNQSLAQAVNNRGQAVGWALNLVPASVNIWEDYPWPFATEQRAALWDNGVVLDLGTLGGPSAWATGINDNGQAIGQSFTTVSTGQPNQLIGWTWSRPVAGFLWENGSMVNLGNLGGTFAQPIRINNRGQVIGFMSVTGDASYHPFLWENGVLKDLGTFGGSSGRANALNDAGEIVGGARTSNGLNRAFLWKNGVMTNLGTLGTHSQAWQINSKGQIVGTSGTTHPNLRAFLWENGGPMLDLNTLVPVGSPPLAVALAINDRGEILCGGPNEQGLFLLVPAPAGKLVAWGYNEFGQTNVPAGNNFVAIAMGEFHCLALRSDGSLAGWGSNYGDKDLDTADIFYGQATVPAGNDFKAIAAGAFHSLALKSDGSLVGWGSNSTFDGSVSGQATVPSGNNFVAIAAAAGGFHSLALKSDGSLVAWGDNSEKQTDVPAGNDFVAIAAGDFHNVAIKSDGSLVVWGDNNVGQVGNMPAGNDFVAIAAGWGQDLALRSNGSMVGWGWNINGQATPRAGTDFVAVAAGWRHSLALKSDGSLVGWGWNYGAAETAGIFYGQAIVPAGNDFVAIAAGDRCSLVIQRVQPVLDIARVGNNVVLSWSLDNTGYTLEANTDLTSPLNWADVPGTPTIVGNLHTVTDSVASGNKFYRLKR